MSDTPRVGWAGVGLMGHGAAQSILRRGFPLTILGHRNRPPVDDLVQQGAIEAPHPGALAAASDVVFLCLPSTVEVEATMASLIDGLRPGMIVVDTTTADPTSTRRLGAMLAERGVAMVDGPLGRTPKEAEAGRLSTFLGGDPVHVARVRPIVQSYAEVIIEAGALGNGHTLKLVNNFISIGTAAVIAEAVATAGKIGVDLRTLFDVVSAGGANSAMFQMVMPWVLEGDDSRLRGPLRIAGKDLRFFCAMAEAARMPAPIAQAVNQALLAANVAGHGERMLPALPGVFAATAGAPIRPLE